ncbi:flagellar basal body rod protein [Bacillus sp. B15-48]|uniref:lmo0954 family membrane protein n=1 Tax=Bacillus sp. B15-48 TaxID=1548601 RepID=UPI00193F7565|nr:flagellar basal body rod protein [Bacillus sp. B15-48]MBM4764457.1 flagellar basal body rod protein [Bacillus sp. B15-48]
MKKLGLLVIGGIAAFVLISNLGSLFGLAVSLLFLYLILKQFLKADTTLQKIAWGVFGLFILLAAASNIPAILAIVAAYVLYLVYKKWNDEEAVANKDNDPFVNFEKQWSELNK